MRYLKWKKKKNRSWFSLAFWFVSLPSEFSEVKFHFFSQKLLKLNIYFFSPWLTLTAFRDVGGRKIYPMWGDSWENPGVLTTESWYPSVMRQLFGASVIEKGPNPFLLEIAFLKVQSCFAVGAKAVLLRFSTSSQCISKRWKISAAIHVWGWSEVCYFVYSISAYWF